MSLRLQREETEELRRRIENGARPSVHPEVPAHVQELQLAQDKEDFNASKKKERTIASQMRSKQSQMASLKK